MRPYQTLTWVVLAAFAGCAGGKGQRDNTDTPSTSFERDVFDPYICAIWSTEAGQWGAEFLNEACSEKNKSSCEADAVAKAGQIVPLGNRAYSRFYESVGVGMAIAKVDADRLAREAFWSDPALERAILLAAHDSCGTPSLGTPTTTMPWESFRPYVAAYLWPVQASPGSEIELYACSEQNGAGQLKGPDELRQAGFLVAVGFAENETMFVALQTLVQAHNQGAERSVPAVADKIEEFLERPESRGLVCRTLAEVRWFTGLSVEECLADGSSPARVVGNATAGSPVAGSEHARGRPSGVP
jgi:hypothetical protein